MMEDIIAILLVIAVLIGVGLTGRSLWRMHKRHKRWKEEEAVAEQKRQIEATRKWRESRYQKQVVPSNSIAIQSGGNISVGISKPSYVPSATQSVQSYNTSTLDDIANLAILANTIHHWNDNKKVETTTTSSSSSSWGFDDDDSRKSASSSFSSSDSSSSSDSGPSSDW
jgi:hypothetical protein